MIGAESVTVMVGRDAHTAGSRSDGGAGPVRPDSRTVGGFRGVLAAVSLALLLVACGGPEPTPPPADPCGPFAAGFTRGIVPPAPGHPGAVGLVAAVGGPIGAPPVVLLHGWPQTGHCWRRVAEDLDDDHTVIVPDLLSLIHI